MLPTPPDGLRHWRLTDAPDLEAAWADPSLRLWNPPPEQADAASWISRCEERWTLGLSLDFVIDADGEVAGEVGLRNFTSGPDRAELGVWVRAGQRRRGFASCAVEAVTRWAGDHLGLAQLWCRTSPENEAAGALFAALGWRRLGERDAAVVWSRAPLG